MDESVNVIDGILNMFPPEFVLLKLEPSHIFLPTLSPSDVIREPALDEVAAVVMLVERLVEDNVIR